MSVAESMDWQPIETAPKDGTDVLTFGMAGMVVARFEDEAWRVYNYGYEDATVRKMPTHWMPLPSEPVLMAAPKNPAAVALGRLGR